MCHKHLSHESILCVPVSITFNSVASFVFRKQCFHVNTCSCCVIVPSVRFKPSSVRNSMPSVTAWFVSAGFTFVWLVRRCCVVSRCHITSSRPVRPLTVKPFLGSCYGGSGRSSIAISGWLKPCGGHLRMAQVPDARTHTLACTQTQQF